MAPAQEKIFDLDVEQGFNFNKTCPKPFGYVLELQIGDEKFAADTNVAKVTEEGKQDVVAVLSRVVWSLAATDPMTLYMQISTPNSEVVAGLEIAKMTKTNVSTKFVTYKYNEKENTFFQHLVACEAVVEAVVRSNDGVYVFEYETAPSTEVMKPKNFFFKLGINSVDKEQPIGLNVSPMGKYIKPWGVAVS